MLVGDKVLAINGTPVNGFQGSFESIFERTILSRGESISYTVQRPGVAEPIVLTSGFETERTKWFQRRGLRQVGIYHSSDTIVDSVSANSPAADAGLKKGDRILAIDGAKLFSPQQFSQALKDKGWKSVRVSIQTAKGETREVEITPEVPLKPANVDPKMGFGWGANSEVDTRIVHPGPIQQVKDSLNNMWVTISSVVSPSSNIGIDHLSGPVGIAKLQYALLQTDDGWRRILAFMVLFNVNLAVLNMMPFPVLDGGHITLAILEKIFGRPVQAKPLEILQTICALALISLMLFVTSKDIGDGFGGGGGGNQEIIFPK